jgi:predicted PurR-regulated permease PerM
MSQFKGQAGNTMMTFLHRTISASAFSGILFVLIPVYTVLILYYRNHWIKIIQQIFRTESREDIRKILFLTVNTYYNFIKGMALVYLTVGVLYSLGLFLLGVPHPILFGFIASILTFIPYIGITIGSLLPMTMAWVMYDSVWYPVGILGIFVFVQYLEANVIFPFAVSSRLNVNTLAMLVAIFLGGIIGGLTGMILFVPFIGIIKLIADHNPKLKILSMILGTASNKKLTHED